MPANQQQDAEASAWPVTDESGVSLYLSRANVTSYMSSQIRRVPSTRDLDKLVVQTRAQMHSEEELQRGNCVVQPLTNAFVYPLSTLKEQPKIIVVESPRRWSRRDEPESVNIDRPAGVGANPSSEIRSDRAAESTAASTAQSPQLSGTDDVSTVTLERAPAGVIHAIAKRILTPELYARYVEPQFADMWHEYCLAIRSGDQTKARLVVRSGLWEVFKPLLYALIRSAFRALKLNAGS